MKPTPKPTDTRLRVIRGGSWYSGVPSLERAASRSSNEPAYRSFVIGFRCALRGKEPRT